MTKLAIIAEDVHQLVRIAPNSNWSNYAWRIHHDADWYWIPVQDHLNYRERVLSSIDPECPRCRMRWYSAATAEI